MENNIPSDKDKNSIAVAANLGTVEAPTIAIEYSRAEDDLDLVVRLETTADGKSNINVRIEHQW